MIWYRKYNMFGFSKYQEFCFSLCVPKGNSSLQIDLEPIIMAPSTRYGQTIEHYGKLTLLIFMHIRREKNLRSCQFSPFSPEEVWLNFKHSATSCISFIFKFSQFWGPF